MGKSSKLTKINKVDIIINAINKAGIFDEMSSHINKWVDFAERVRIEGLGGPESAKEAERAAKRFNKSAEKLPKSIYKKQLLIRPESSIHSAFGGMSGHLLYDGVDRYRMTCHLDFIERFKSTAWGDLDLEFLTNAISRREARDYSWYVKEWGVYVANGSLLINLASKYLIELCDKSAKKDWTIAQSFKFFLSEDCGVRKITPEKSVKFSGDHPLSIEFQELNNEKEEIQRKAADLASDIWALIGNKHTVSAILKVWPEAEELLPKNLGKTESKEIAVLPKELNDKIGLPSDKEKAA